MTAWQPARLTSTEAHARAVVARHGQAVPLGLDAAWQATLAPLPLGEPARPWQGGWSLVAEWGGGRFVLRLPEAVLLRLVEGRLGGLELQALPEELAAAVLENTAAHLAAAMAPQRRGSARLLQATRQHEAAPALPHRIAVLLARPANDERFEAELCTDATGLLLAAGTLRQRPPAAAAAMERQPVRLQLTIARTQLAAGRLAALRQHDVLLFDQVLWHRREDGAAVLRADAAPLPGLTVALRGSQLEVMALWKEAAMAEDIPLPDTDASAHELPSLDALPVSLSFDLGALTLPLGELRRLVVGQVFDLGQALAGAVRVRANGALVGEGELVEIDGRLGVALTRLAGSEAP